MTGIVRMVTLALLHSRVDSIRISADKIKISEDQR